MIQNALEETAGMLGSADVAHGRRERLVTAADTDAHGELEEGLGTQDGTDGAAGEAWCAISAGGKASSFGWGAGAADPALDAALGGASGGLPREDS